MVRGSFPSLNTHGKYVIHTSLPTCASQQFRSFLALINPIRPYINARENYARVGILDLRVSGAELTMHFNLTRPLPRRYLRARLYLQYNNRYVMQHFSRDRNGRECVYRRKQGGVVRTSCFFSAISMERNDGY